MIIKELFVKPIDRAIQGVIKVGQTEDSYIRQELEEYIVTNELKKHFKEFFGNYSKGISGDTDKIGVWISGFFGSGKSHFLKILSYLLENREVDGRKALDYFKDNGKIDDSFLIADMTRVAGDAANTDVMLFNIDSKNSSGSGNDRDPIVSVFLRVFNEMQGFCGPDPYVADLERRLAEQNKLEEFKEIFLKKAGNPWDEARYDVGFIQDSVISAITEAGFMSHEAAGNWCEKTAMPYAISNEDFARLIKKYLERKGKNHRIIFMVDEMGQFIGQDSRLMLNLQTLVEDLGTACLGKAWIIVTSQEDIDSITKNMAARSNDFSKIQGRFDTRLSLSSADVGEVIRKRILEKTDSASQTLSLLYENKATVIKNLIVFSDTAQKKLYEDAENFAADYPFIPYQFDLLGNVLTAIRQHGASGKHLAQGERSMIALFKESAMRLSRENIGPFAPFNLFYDALDQFLDSGHRSVIQSALRNDRINPAKKESCLAVDVLKTLFLVKYVKEIIATLENITSLMCASIEEDRLALTKHIQDALKILIEETLVSKNGDVYIFLTNEEQEVNREIERQNVSSADLIQSASVLIFDDIIGENKYKLAKFNGRHSYSYNQIVDAIQHNPRQNHPITLHVLTPDSGQQTDTASLHMKSSETSGVLVALPQQTGFLDELRRQLRIEKYLRTNAYRSLQKANDIERELQNENKSRKDAAKSLLEDALREARIFVNGNEESIGNKDIKSRIRDALDSVINSVYHKLSYIDTPLGIDNIRNLFSQNTPVLLSGGGNPNRHALDDMSAFIESNSQKHQKTSMRTLQDRFMREPYGFVEDDVEWLCAKLFKDGAINVYISNAQITVQDKTANDLVNYFTKKQYADSLTTEIRKRTNDAQLKTAREIMKAFFNDSAPDDDEDELYQKFKQKGRNLLEQFERFAYKYREYPEYPGEAVVAGGIDILQHILPVSSSFSFFDELSRKKDEMLDFAEDKENIENFFSGPQSAIFANAVNATKSFDRNINFITGNEIQDHVAGIKSIISMKNPYKEIYKLPDLTDKYNKALAEQCQKDREPLLFSLEDKKKSIVAKLAGKSYGDDFNASLIIRFDAMEKKIKKCGEPSLLKVMNYEIDLIYTDALNEVDIRDAELAETQAKGPLSGDPARKPKHTNHVPIKSLVNSPSWHIETADDIDNHLTDLRRRISAEMKDDDILSVEF
jgi:hypothetical protein